MRSDGSSFSSEGRGKPLQKKKADTTNSNTMMMKRSGTIRKGIEKGRDGVRKRNLALDEDSLSDVEDVDKNE